MDRSADSIGSCSLDVDADSSDISDTSGSLNFPTPISVKDITQEFTENIRERCSIRTVQTSTLADPVKGVRMVLTQPLSSSKQSSALPESTGNVSPDKKPSYLNLACCVNGYSNLTTYDSKVRQDINKSREVSPIRPSSSSIQYCKKNNSLAPPVLHTMPNTSIKTPNACQYSAGNKYTNLESNNNSHNENGDNYSCEPSQDTLQKTSFIQQRVERLYGPGALAQRFYSPKKVRSCYSKRSSTIACAEDNLDTTELTRKFQQLTPSKDYSNFRKKLSDASGSNSERHATSVAYSAPTLVGNNADDLPVLRHLSQEFRAQLPTISPKRNFSNTSPGKDTITKLSKAPEVSYELKGDEVDHKTISNLPCMTIVDDLREIIVTNKPDVTTTISNTTEKNGNYFLGLLKEEQARLLSLAGDGEKYIAALSDNPDVTEDVLGFLRSASGKARLLVTQKLKQFEGLCHNNLNRSPEDKFPTTVDDLQGFWDMVNLQIDDITSIFEEIELLKSNNWKRAIDSTQAAEPVKNKNQKPIKTANTKSKSTNSNGNSSKTTAALSAAALKRESQRKQLLEMKRKNRIAMAATSNTSLEVESNSVKTNSIELLVSENSSSIPN